MKRITIVLLLLMFLVIPTGVASAEGFGDKVKQIHRLKRDVELKQQLYEELVQRFIGGDKEAVKQITYYFIENGKLHAQPIIQDILTKLFQ